MQMNIHYTQRSERWEPLNSIIHERKDTNPVVFMDSNG